MEKIIIPIKKECHQLSINHNGFRQLNACFIISYYEKQELDTVLIIEHNNFKLSDLIDICAQLGLITKTSINEDSVSCTKIYGLPYDGLGGTIRNAFQIVWDFYLCF
jgi:hypothetical protein